MNDTSRELKCHIPYMIRLNAWFLKYSWLFLYLNSWKENKKPDNKSDTYNQIRIAAILMSWLANTFSEKVKFVGCKKQNTQAKRRNRKGKMRESKII